MMQHYSFQGSTEWSYKQSSLTVTIGFAILGYNVQNASVSQTHIRFFEHHIAEIQRNHTIGSGTLFLHQDNLYITLRLLKWW